MAAFEDEEYIEEISQEEKLAIVSQFLLSSPPGQIKHVLEDLRVLCGNEFLSDETVEGMFRKYNNETNQVLKTSGIVCDDSLEVEPNLYNNFNDGTVVKVDAIAQCVEEEVDQIGESEFDSERQSIQHALNEYVESQYCKGTSVVNVTINSDGRATILISGEKLNLKNYWSGRWQTRLELDLNSQALEGFIKLRIHYFEDGNVQMTSEKVVEGVTVEVGNPDTLGENVKKVVAEQEGLIQKSLEDMYKNMSNETVKDMRRALPITGQKMDWSGAQMELAKGFGSK